MEPIERLIARHNTESFKELMIQWGCSDYIHTLEMIFERPLTPKEIRIVEDAIMDELI